MKKRQKKVFTLGVGFLSSVVVALVLIAGLVFWQFSGSADSFEDQGDHAFAQGAYSSALEFWARAADQVRNPAGIYRKMGTAYLKLSNLDQAENRFKKAVENDPLDLWSQKEVVRILLIKGDMDGAQKLLSRLLEQHPKDPGVLMLSGDRFMLQGVLKKGHDAYRKAVDQASGQPRPLLKLAICLLELNKKAPSLAAEKILAQCLEKGIRDPMDFMLLADYYLLAGDNIKAEKIILHAVESDPENLGFKLRLCRFYRSAGMEDRASVYLGQLLKKYPDHVGFRLMLADLQLSRMDMAAAEESLTRLKKMKAGGPGYHLLMGRFWLYKGLYSHGVSYLKAALEENSGLVGAYYLLGVAYFAGGQTKLAENVLVNALMLDPLHIESLMAMAALNYKSREYDLSIQHIDRLLSQDPSHAGAWQVRGLCLLEKAEFSEATQAFSRAWHLGGDVSSLFFLGQALEGEGKTQAALAAYDAVFETAPEMVDVLNRLTGLLSGIGRGKEVLGKIDRQIERGKTHPAIYYTGARISLEMGDYAQCRAYIGAALKKTDLGQFYLLLAELHRKEGDHNAVEQALVSCTAACPHFLKGWLHLAGYYVKQGLTAQAQEVLEEAIKRFPEEPQIMGNLAWLLLEGGADVDRALELARDAYERLPGEPWLLDTLGWAYYHKDVFSQAEYMLTQAEEKFPDKARIQFHLGMAFYRQGKLLEARTKLDAVIGRPELSPSERDMAREILAGLKGGKPSNDLFDIQSQGGERMILDPDAVPSLEFPGNLDQGEDILEPDWTKLKGGKS